MISREHTSFVSLNEDNLIKRLALNVTVGTRAESSGIRYIIAVQGRQEMEDQAEDR